MLPVFSLEFDFPIYFAGRRFCRPGRPSPEEAALRQSSRTMRTDLPVTQREFPIPDDLTTMSITDTDSRIVYINKVFAEISGYSHDELVGQMHNVVRHPDMPAEIFADMWGTLRGGHLWSGIIKNRRKDGDHYWVRVIATPITRGGKLVGYMSVRTKPAPE